MDNNELEKKSSAQPFVAPTTKVIDAASVTSTVKKRRPKDPGRIAAGTKLAEHNKKVKEAKKKNKIQNESKEMPSKKHQVKLKRQDHFH